MEGFMHDVELPRLTVEECRRAIERAADSEAVAAVLVLLRVLSAESTALARRCARNRRVETRGPGGEVLATTMDNVEFHEGAAGALEDAFWLVQEANQGLAAEEDSTTDGH
jgi:hypothetical protein